MTIKGLRASTGMSQSQFAEWLHIPKGTIQNWEQGIRQCPDYVLELIQFKIEHSSDSHENSHDSDISLNEKTGF